MKRDFTYIDDIVEGVWRVMNKLPEANPGWDGKNPDPASSSAPYRLFNIGNNRPVDLLHFIGLIEKKLGREAEEDPAAPAARRRGRNLRRYRRPAPPRGLRPGHAGGNGRGAVHRLVYGVLWEMKPGRFRRQMTHGSRSGNEIRKEYPVHRGRLRGRPDHGGHRRQVPGLQSDRGGRQRGAHPALEFG